MNEELEPVAKIVWIPCMETWSETTSEPGGEGSKDLWKAEWIYTRKMEKEAQIMMLLSGSRIVCICVFDLGNVSYVILTEL